MNQPVSGAASDQDTDDLARRLGAPGWVRNRQLLEWVGSVAGRTRPARIHWCDGSEQEYDRLCEQMVAAGTIRRLNPAKRPNSYLCLLYTSPSPRD